MTENQAAIQNKNQMMYLVAWEMFCKMLKDGRERAVLEKANQRCAETLNCSCMALR